MYTNLYVYMAYRQYMSGKLYWRIKKDGKWTWTSAEVTGWTTDGRGGHIVEPYTPKEEEE
ncbi:hypothetical protein ES705_37014 [subsurface metagenome]